MSTIIRLRGINFNNPALPVVSSFVRNGLVGAFRPAGDASSMVDLSGNGVTLTKRGNPSFTQYGILGNGVNGYRTNIPETMNQTLMAVFRGHKGTSFNCLAISNYLNDVAGAERGSSVWMALANGTGENKIDVGARTQTHYKRASDNAYTNNIHASVINDEVDSTTFLTSDWVFAALVVDATGNIQQTFVPKNNSSGPVQETNFTTATNPGSLATRHLTDPATGAPNMFQICSVDDLTWVSAQSEVAEALVYNRALSTAEIMEQYELSKEFMFKVRGISI